jgi:hypothetical protein
MPLQRRMKHSLLCSRGSGIDEAQAQRAFVAVEQRRQPLIGVPAAKQSPRTAQREEEQMDRLRLLADPHPEQDCLSMSASSREITQRLL